MRKSICILLLLFVLTGITMCSTLHSVSITQIPQERENRIQVVVHDWGFFGIHTSNKITDDAREKLEAKCRGGKITGILTKYADYNYLLTVKREITVTAFCVK